MDRRKCPSTSRRVDVSGRTGFDCGGAAITQPANATNAANEQVCAVATDRKIVAKAFKADQLFGAGVAAAAGVDVAAGAGALAVDAGAIGTAMVGSAAPEPVACLPS